MNMENDWDSVLQFVSEPLDLDFNSEKHVSERTERNAASFSSSQVPTPPESSAGSPAGESSQDSTLVSVSTTFYPGAEVNSNPPDLILLSPDSVFFYVQSHVLLGASENGFKSLLPAPPSKDGDNAARILTVSEPSDVLNIILHTIYEMSCSHYSPSFNALCTAVDGLKSYGVPLKTHVAPSRPLFIHLLSQAPLHPIDTYALAARYDLYDLAVLTSSHLLSLSLSSLTDEIAERMGAIYLKRLFFLHIGRSDALKHLLLPPPYPHGPTPFCDFNEQKSLTRAWALASAYLAWEARPDLSTSTMESALSPLVEDITCDLCRTALKDRIRKLVVQWSLVKRTI